MIPPSFSANSGGASTLRAFTMVELLVVVGVIGILATLLMPTLKKMQVKSQAASCSNNLRQLGMFSVTYAADNNDEFPAPWTSNYLWMDKLIADTQCGGDLVKARAVMSTNNKLGTRCPVRLRADSDYSTLFRSSYSPVAARDGGNWWYNYGMNYVNLSDPNPSGGRIPFRRSTVQKPSQCIFLADSNIEAGGSPRDLNPGWSAAYPADRHNGRCNVLWVDGHVTAETQAWLINPANLKFWLRQAD